MSGGIPRVGPVPCVCGREEHRLQPGVDGIFGSVVAVCLSGAGKGCRAFVVAVDRGDGGQAAIKAGRLSRVDALGYRPPLGLRREVPATAMRTRVRAPLATAPPPTHGSDRARCPTTTTWRWRRCRSGSCARRASSFATSYRQRLLKAETSAQEKARSSPCRHATFSCEVVFYFDVEDTRIVPRRLQELAAAAQSVGFDFHGARAEEGSEPDTGDIGWTGYAPLPSRPPDSSVEQAPLSDLELELLGICAQSPEATALLHEEMLDEDTRSGADRRDAPWPRSTRADDVRPRPVLGRVRPRDEPREPSFREFDDDWWTVTPRGRAALSKRVAIAAFAFGETPSADSSASGRSREAAPRRHAQGPVNAGSSAQSPTSAAAARIASTVIWGCETIET